MFSAVSRANIAFSRLASKAQRRAHGSFQGNSRVEEYAGLREISYWSWEFTATSIARITGYFIIPGTIFYNLVVAEFDKRNELIGRPEMEYGILPYYPPRK